MTPGSIEIRQKRLRKRSITIAVALMLAATGVFGAINFSRYQSAVGDKASSLDQLAVRQARALSAEFMGGQTSDRLKAAITRSGIFGPGNDHDATFFVALGRGKDRTVFEVAGKTLRALPKDTPLARALDGGEAGTLVTRGLPRGDLIIGTAPIANTGAVWAAAFPTEPIRAPYLRDAVLHSLLAVVGILVGLLLLIRVNRALTRELKETLSRLSKAQIIGKMGHWELDVATQKLWWSDEIYRMLKLDAEQVTDRFAAFQKSVHPQDRDRVATAVRRALEENEPYSIQHRSIRGDGSEIVVHEMGEVVFGDDGAPARLVGMTQDVTEHWHAVEILDRLHGELDVIFNNSAIGISFVKGRKIIRANEFYEQMFGCTRGQAAGMDVGAFFITEAEAADAWEQAAQVLKRGQSVVGERLLRRQDTGDPFWCRVTGKRVEGEDGDGDEAHSIWVLEDISERKKSEETLRLSEHRYKVATSGIRDGAWDIDLETGTTWLSPVWAELIGLSEEEMSGYDWKENIHPDDLPAMERSLSKALKGESPTFWQELRHRHRDGRWLWFLCRGTFERDGTGRATRFSGRISEITRRKQAEDALRKAYAEMENRVEERTRELRHELTERKRAEDALRESDERLKTLAELSPVGLFKADLDGGVTFANDSVAEILGISRNELLAAGWNKAIHSGDVERVLSDWNQAAPKGEHFRTEYRVVSGDQERWIYAQARPELNGDGKVTGYIGTLTDITERKVVELALKSSDQQLRTLTRLSPVGLYRADRDGNCEYATERYCRISGWELDDVLGTGWLNAIHPDDRDLLMAQWRNAVETGASFEIETRMIGPDGRVVWVLAQAIPETDASGQVTSFIGSITDITERKIAEDEVKRSEERLRLILDNAADGIITIDAGGRIQSFNAAAEAIFGYAASEVLDQNVSLLMPEPYRSEHEGYLENYQRGGPEKVIGAGSNVRGRRKDGTVFPLYLAVGTPASRDTEFFTGIVRDMTEAVAAEEALREAKVQAETANRAKSEFLSRMSHELRTPMNAILGFAQLLELNQNQALSDEQKEFVGQILSSGHHLLALINEVLDLAKIESGHLEIDLEDLAPAPVVQQSLALIEPGARARGIRLINRLEGADVPNVRAGAIRLKQVMTNLLSNALKYNVDGGSITVDYEIRGETLRLGVSDTGRGIPERDQLDIFDPFVRHEDENSEIEGTGIGLAITKNMVELMGGKIFVESSPGHGSTFSVDLMIAAGANPSPRVAPPATAGSDVRPPDTVPLPHK